MDGLQPNPYNPHRQRVQPAPRRLHFGLLTFHLNQGLAVEVLHDAGRQQLWSQAGPEVLCTDGKGKKNRESSTDIYW